MAKKPSAKQVIIDKAYELVMRNGFSATSVDTILEAAGLTKGAFFYYFKAKSDLGLALAHRYVERDNNAFRQVLELAEAQSDDPLQRMLLFLEGLADYLGAQTEVPSCIFASFCYDTHTEDVAEFMQSQVNRWKSHYTRLFRQISDRYPSRLPEVSEEELANQFMCVIEGGYVLSRVYKEPQQVAQNLLHFRNYVSLLFGTPVSAQMRPVEETVAA